MKQRDWDDLNLSSLFVRNTKKYAFLKVLITISVQVLYSNPDQSKSGSACHMTRSANHRRHILAVI